MEEVQGAWEMFEDDGSGTVDLRELKIAMRSLGFDVGKRDVTRLVYQVRNTWRMSSTFCTLRSDVSVSDCTSRGEITGPEIQIVLDCCSQCC